MMALQGKGHAEQLKLSTAGDIMLLVGAILGSAFLFSTALLGILAFHERKKRKIPTLEENPIPSVPYETVKPLKKNWRVFPFLPESVLRLLSLVLILISSIDSLQHRDDGLCLGAFGFCQSDRTLPKRQEFYAGPDLCAGRHPALVLRSDRDHE
jgi:hypothetical protein